MYIIGLLDHVLEIIFTEDYASDSGADVGREMALPQGTDHSMTAFAIEVVLTDIIHQGAR